MTTNIGRLLTEAERDEVDRKVVRRLIETLVRGHFLEWQEHIPTGYGTEFGAKWLLSLSAKPLTTAQLLAVSVLVGDPAVSERFLIDHLMDGGVVLKTADEVRAEERQRIKSLLIARADAGDADAGSLYALYDAI